MRKEENETMLLLWTFPDSPKGQLSLSSQGLMEQVSLLHMHDFTADR